jgi:starch synthase
MKVLFVTSEAYPLIKTGGLADVSHSLPNQLQAAGADVRLLLPAYRSVLEKLDCVRVLGWIDTGFGTQVRILETRHEAFDMPVWLVDESHLFDRPGNPYTNADGHDWADNPRRFNQFSHAAALLAADVLDTGWRADIVHANDWQTALVPAYLSFSMNRPKSVFTIHNIAYDCQFDYGTFQAMHLPPHWWSTERGEFYGRFSMLKAGLIFADQITTVSPRYAEEICSAEYGYGYADILKANCSKLSGIINGIDTKTWNPATDPLLASNYSADDNLHKAKRDNRKELLEALGAPEKIINSRRPLLGFVGRMAYQKGIDMLLDSIETIVTQHKAIFVLIGSGDRDLEQRLKTISQKYPECVYSHVGYSERLAHLLEAGCDLFVMPSRYEPCGLNQMYSLHYGTPPIVRNTGGLADTVTDLNDETFANGTATGFLFDEASSVALTKAIEKALAAFNDKQRFASLIHNGMQKDVSWNASAKEYLQLYRMMSNE